MTKDYSNRSRIALVIIAVLGWFAIILQLIIMLQSKAAATGELITRFFSFFTIDTNLAVAFCSTMLLTTGIRPGFFKKQHTIAAIAVYISIVCLVYNIILRWLWQPTGIQALVDELLHLVVPGLFVAFWLIAVPKDELKWKNAFAWMIYPAIYGTIVLIRGKLSGFYPYPFIDASDLGWNQTIINTIAFVFIFLFAGLIFIAIGRYLAGKRIIAGGETK